VSHESGVSRDRLEHDAVKMTEAEFAVAHPGPFLAFDVPPEDDDLNFLTEVPGQPATRKNVVVAPIKKRSGEGAITVGRASESDVAIRDPSVSKLHAHFAEGAPLVLTDLASHNGTKIDGVALVAHRPTPVKTGSTIEFGSVTTRVIDVHAAYELLRR